MHLIKNVILGILVLLGVVIITFDCILMILFDKHTLMSEKYCEWYVNLENKWTRIRK